MKILGDIHRYPVMLILNQAGPPAERDYSGTGTIRFHFVETVKIWFF